MKFGNIRDLETLFCKEKYRQYYLNLLNIHIYNNELISYGIL